MEGMTNDVEKSNEMVFVFLKTLIYVKGNTTLDRNVIWIEIDSGINSGREARE